MKEIVTLQFGGSANAVADQLWKLQRDQLDVCGGGPNDVDPNVLLRRSSSVSSAWCAECLPYTITLQLLDSAGVASSDIDF